MQIMNKKKIERIFIDPGDIVLEARGITKRFPGVVALDDVSFQIVRGKVNVLVGENGAGKSTLMKILSGVYRDYEGEIELDGEPISFNSPRHAQEKGIAIIHQELNLFPDLDVGENVFLGREFRTGLGLVDFRRIYEETRKILHTLDLDIDPKRPVSSLRVGEQQIVEIAKALSLKARIIIMDEPTSAISEHEIQVLFRLIKTLIKQNVAIVYITHKLDELFEIGDIVNVFRDGKSVSSALDIDSLTHEDIIRMMVGRDLQDLYPKSDSKQDEEAMRCEKICLNHPQLPGEFLVDHVSFTLKKGEVLGIFGLMGAGRTELLETIFGVHDRESSGTISLGNRTVSIKNPKQAIDAGIGFVTEDRKAQGLLLQMSVGANISLPSLKRVERYFMIHRKKEEQLIRKYIHRMNIKTPSHQHIVETLSGGNQQKVVLAKWLATDPKILLLDEPTRGIDVNAKREIYMIIEQLAALGIGIVVVSSELPEILAISDRVMVMAEGKKIAEFPKSKATEEDIMKAATRTLET